MQVDVIKELIFRGREKRRQQKGEREKRRQQKGEREIKREIARERRRQV
jgi:hypothetical protein